MKRKSCLIEAFDAEKVSAENKNKVYLCSSESEEKMYKNSIWYKSLLDAEKTCLKDDKIKKFHYKFDDGREMVEEYNLDTQVLLRRSWKVKGKLGGEGKWTVELGDPIPDATPNTDQVDIVECKDQIVSFELEDLRHNLPDLQQQSKTEFRRYFNPLASAEGCGDSRTIGFGFIQNYTFGWTLPVNNLQMRHEVFDIPDGYVGTYSITLVLKGRNPVVTRRNTRINLEWRIRNMPYPIETYSIKANDDEKCVVVSTTNKKFFKKLHVPELVRLGLSVEQANIYSTHNFNTLVVVYKKPQELLNMEKEWFLELQKVKPIKDIPNDCKTQ